MYKIRFNLGRGDNYMKWKIEDTTTTTKKVHYLDPNEVSLTLVNCTLHNNKNRSEEIFLGGHKSVCSWVLCEKVLIDAPRDVSGEQIRYNPKVAPHWSHNNEVVDGKEYSKLKTKGKNIYYAK
tara:strand:- start:2003 stop:2371 length:369 start_codon:yes stop_codon:yes gene_type:complete